MTLVTRVALSFHGFTKKSVVILRHFLLVSLGSNFLLVS